jgi:hypothetical protein
LKKILNACLCLIILIFPATSAAIENQDVLSLIGYEFTNVKTGKLEIDYRMDFMDYEYDTEPGKIYGISNAIFLAYDVARPISLNIMIPYVYRKDKMGTESPREEADFGDASIGGKAELYSGKNLSLNLNINYFFSTGKSPYENNMEIDIPTGSGYDSIQTIFSIGTSFHPFFPFLSLQYNKGFSIKNLDTFRYGTSLEEVKPADILGGELGIGFPVSEKFTVLLGYKYLRYWNGEYRFSHGAMKLQDFIEASFNIGFGWKISDLIAMHLNLMKNIEDDSSVYYEPIYQYYQAMPDYQINLSVLFTF